MESSRTDYVYQSWGHVYFKRIPLHDATVELWNTLHREVSPQIKVQGFISSEYVAEDVSLYYGDLVDSGIGFGRLVADDRDLEYYVHMMFSGGCLPIFKRVPEKLTLSQCTKCDFNFFADGESNVYFLRGAIGKTRAESGDHYFNFRIDSPILDKFETVHRTIHRTREDDRFQFYEKHPYKIVDMDSISSRLSYFRI